jgi:gas vesicle protein
MSDRDSGFFSGVLFGAAVGFLLGVLFAPAKGEETRKVIVDKSREVADELKTRTDEVVEKVKSRMAARTELAGDSELH